MPEHTEYPAHIQRALDALYAIPDDFADVGVTKDGCLEVLPYWSPECVDPDGRPIGTDRKHVDQWERVTDVLETAGFEEYQPEETAVQRMGRLLGWVAGRMHQGAPVLFRYVGGDDA